MAVTPSASTPKLIDGDPEQSGYHLPDALVEFKISTGLITYGNRMAEILQGYSSAEFASGMHARTLVTEESWEQLVAPAAELIGFPSGPDQPYKHVDAQNLIEITMVKKSGAVFDTSPSWAHSYLLRVLPPPIGGNHAESPRHCQ